MMSFTPCLREQVVWIVFCLVRLVESRACLSQHELILFMCLTQLPIAHDSSGHVKNKMALLCQTFFYLLTLSVTWFHSCIECPLSSWLNQFWMDKVMFRPTLFISCSITNHTEEKFVVMCYSDHKFELLSFLYL